MKSQTIINVIIASSYILKSKIILLFVMPSFVSSDIFYYSKKIIIIIMLKKKSINYKICLYTLSTSNFYLEYIICQIVLNPKPWESVYYNIFCNFKGKAKTTKK